MKIGQLCVKTPFKNIFLTEMKSEQQEQFLVVGQELDQWVLSQSVFLLKGLDYVNLGQSSAVDRSMEYATSRIFTQEMSLF